MPRYIRKQSKLHSPYLKKGQMLSQPLIYIFAMIVGALILIFGVKAIIDFQDQATTVSVGQEIDSLKSNIGTYSQYNKGSTKKVTLNFPEEVEMFCFYDSSQPEEAMLDGKEKSLTGLGYNIDVYFDKKKDHNFLVLPSGAIEHIPTSQYIGEISLPEGNPACFKTTKQFLIKSLGGYAEIKTIK